mmetsp:Transcript_3193/g.2668  ORF Transcript_3193/g.2668 Transcript_3193/m.2668 type:complete len:204 (+) Transcript_3193:260-871(+)
MKERNRDIDTITSNNRTERYFKNRRILNQNSNKRSLHSRSNSKSYNENTDILELQNNIKKVLDGLWKYKEKFILVETGYDIIKFSINSFMDKIISAREVGSSKGSSFRGDNQLRTSCESKKKLHLRSGDQKDHKTNLNRNFTNNRIDDRSKNSINFDKEEDKKKIDSKLTEDKYCETVTGSTVKMGGSESNDSEDELVGVMKI